MVHIKKKPLKNFKKKGSEYCFGTLTFAKVINFFFVCF